MCGAIGADLLTSSRSPVTDDSDIRRTLARLGLLYGPALRPTCTRGPPLPAADLPDGADPPLLDDSADTPWQDDCQLPLHDDAPQAPPNAEI